MKTWIFLNGVFAFAIFALSRTSAGQLAFSEHLGRGFTLRWDYDNNNITLEVTGPTLGWIGIGFSAFTTMEDSDLLIMGISNGESYARDYWSSMNGVVTLDFSQDITILESYENSTHTTVRVTRPLQTTDQEDKNIMDGENNVLWAYGSEEKLEEDRYTDYHTDRGHRSLVLLRKKIVEKSTFENNDHDEPVKVPERTTTTREKQPSKVVNEYIHFPYMVPLDFDHTVHLLWNFDDNDITLQFIAPTTGWVGIGFSQTASMRGADLIMAGVNSGNESYVLDAHGEVNGVPIIDENQDVKLISGWENGTHTAVTVTRKRITCDEDDMKINEGTYRIIWAYGENDINVKQLDRNDYHLRNRGAKSLKLINPVVENGDKDEEDWKYFDIRPTDFKVPKKDTYYLCKYFKIPLTEKHHIVKLEPYITKGNERNVHHILIFLCDDDPTINRSLEANRTCFDDVNPFLEGCRRTLAGWTIGLTEVRYPVEAGFPVGDSTSPKYVMIETHYDNPDMEEIVDSSGIRFYYTKKLRKHDIGILTVSHGLQTIWIPPQSEKFEINGHCADTCLSRGMALSNLQEVNIVGTVLHSHLAGSAMKLHHFRNGSEIEPIAVDDHYDFDYQEIQYKEEEKVKIKTGDSLRVECNYNTLNKEKVTPGGLATHQEMCVAFMFHYPAMKLDYCDSRAKLLEDFPGMQTFMRDMNFTISMEEFGNIASEIRKHPYYAMAIMSPMLDRIQWTKEKRQYAEDFMKSRIVMPLCTAGDEWLMGYWDELPDTEYDKYVEEDVCKTKIMNQTTKPYAKSTPFVVLAGSIVVILFLAVKLRPKN